MAFRTGCRCRRRPSARLGSSAGRRRPWRRNSLRAVCASVAGLGTGRVQSLRHRHLPSGRAVWRVGGEGYEAAPEAAWELRGALAGVHAPAGWAHSQPWGNVFGPVNSCNGLSAGVGRLFLVRPLPVCCRTPYGHPERKSWAVGPRDRHCAARSCPSRTDVMRPHGLPGQDCRACQYSHKPPTAPAIDAGHRNACRPGACCKTRECRWRL
jgi:hypothetical protein